MKRTFIKNRRLQAVCLLAILLLGYSLPALSQQEQRVGIGTNIPEARLDVIGKVKADTVGKPSGDFYIQAGRDIRLLTGSVGAVTPGTSGVTSLGTTTLRWSALYVHKMQADSFRMPLNAVDGKVLTSDATGNASWHTLTAIDLDSVYYPQQEIWTVSGSDTVPVNPRNGVKVERGETVSLPYDSTWVVSLRAVQSGCNNLIVPFYYNYNLYLDAAANQWKITQTNNGITAGCSTTYLWFGLCGFKIRQ